MGFGIFSIGDEDWDKEVRVENVDAHRSVALAGFVRRFLGLRGLFFKTDDAPVFVHFDDAELVSSFTHGNLNGTYCNVGGEVEMLLEHLGVVHFVDVVAGEDEDVFGALAADGVDVLIDGVGGAAIPLFADAHLGRKDFNKFAEANNGRPAGSNMAAKAESFVLGEDENAAEIGVDAVGESDVNDAVSGAERNGGLGAIAGEGPQALALTTGEKNDDGIAHVGHGTSSGRAAERGERQEARRSVVREAREKRRNWVKPGEVAMRAIG